MVKMTALCIILSKDSNPLKGYLSYYNFFLKGEITKLIFKNIINLFEKEKIILYKNDICPMIPEKIIFFVNFPENTLNNEINKYLLALNVNKGFIVRG